jgi:hypothetical protein
MTTTIFGKTVGLFAFFGLPLALLCFALESQTALTNRHYAKSEKIYAIFGLSRLILGVKISRLRKG